MRYLVHEAFKVLGESDWKSMILFAAPRPTPAVPLCAWVTACLSCLQVSWQHWAMNPRLQPSVV